MRVARALLAFVLSLGVAGCAGDGQTGPDELPGGPVQDDAGGAGEGY